ncbi:lipoprotein [Mycoplasma mycoides]|uniref:lipoprotein n=1 Tax=Mycoplasma mycoides TaxID=2102 RepID=UPI00223F59A8|nr:lipoprotein [Mycoplasma mycoides]QVK08517.1 lipoprotein [Mycoplasma mycoides subsp. capri]
MKKLLTILGSIGLMATTSAAVIACGDRTPQKSSDTKSVKQPRKEEKKPVENNGKEEKNKPDFSIIEGKLLGNFEPNKNNMIPQANIKKAIAQKLGISEVDLQGLSVNYEDKKGEVTLPRFDNKKLEFTFTSFLDLGKIKIEKTGNILFISHGEIKKELAKKLDINESNLQELQTDSSSDISTGSVKSKTFIGTLEFKFEIEEKK